MKVTKIKFLNCVSMSLFWAKTSLFCNSWIKEYIKINHIAFNLLSSLQIFSNPKLHLPIKL